MLENIKLILGLKDDNNDVLIVLYINRISAMVLSHCNLKKLDKNLEGFVEEKVVSIVQNKINLPTGNTPNVKSISRGDTKIEYNTSNTSISGTSGILTDSDKEFLYPYCVVKLC